MRYLLPCIIIILLIVISLLLIRIYNLYCGLGEITREVARRTESDTNTLIGVSVRDKYCLELTSQLNEQLRALRRERQRYMQGDRELKEAVTNVSHDLRTPLTAINGYLTLLEREDKSEAAERYLDRIGERVGAMKELTEELFRYSVITSDDKLEKKNIDLVAALAENLLSFYGIMQEKSIEPDISLPEKKIIRELDETALNRIFSNLISNMLKYTDGDLCVSMDEGGRMCFSNSARELDAVAVGRLFDRFYTVRSNRNSTGLGLSIAKYLTERMGGSIEAEYNNGRLYIFLSFDKEK